MLPWDLIRFISLGIWDNHHSLNGHGCISFVLSEAGSPMVKCPSNTLSDFRAFPVKVTGKGRKVEGEIKQTHQFLMGIKKREKGNSLSSTLDCNNTLGVKPAIVLNTHVAFIGIPAKSKEFQHLKTQRTLNPHCKFRSLRISLCLIRGTGDLWKCQLHF